MGAAGIWLTIFGGAELKRRQAQSSKSECANPKGTSSRVAGCRRLQSWYGEFAVSQAY